MTVVLTFPPAHYSTVLAHLLPRRQVREEAAFAYARANGHADDPIFEVVAVWTVPRHMLSAQYADYLELSDEAQAHVIKEAHQLDASIIEMHSHVGPWPAAFSMSDRAGLRETVPHMWWRLKGKPYFAVVMAHTGFDALAWLHDPAQPAAIASVRVGDKTLRPTNLSLGRWQ